jgi:hypothetical protein
MCSLCFAVRAESKQSFALRIAIRFARLSPSLPVKATGPAVAEEDASLCFNIRATFHRNHSGSEHLSVVAGYVRGVAPPVDWLARNECNVGQSLQLFNNNNNSNNY